MIPKLHYLSQGNTPELHIENIQRACSSGAELVVLHLQNVSDKKHLKLATEAREITAHFQTRLLIYNDYKIAKAVKADGVFIDKITVNFTQARIHLYTWQLIVVVAHTLQECQKHLENQVDCIYLGPFKSDENNNKATNLGLNGFAAIIDVLKTQTPILGIGNVTSKDVTEILATGISGVAVSDEITANFDSIKVFHQLLNTSSAAEQKHTF